MMRALWFLQIQIKRDVCNLYMASLPHPDIWHCHPEAYLTMWPEHIQYTSAVRLLHDFQSYTNSYYLQSFDSFPTEDHSYTMKLNVNLRPETQSQ